MDVVAILGGARRLLLPDCELLEIDSTHKVFPPFANTLLGSAAEGNSGGGSLWRGANTAGLRG